MAWSLKWKKSSQTTCTSSATGTAVVASTNGYWFCGGIRFENLGTAHEEVFIYDGAANASVAKLIDVLQIPYDATDTYLNYYMWHPPYPVKIHDGLYVKTTNATAASALPLEARRA